MTAYALLRVRDFTIRMVFLCDARGMHRVADLAWRVLEAIDARCGS